jgi:hypothetical protein
MSLETPDLPEAVIALMEEVKALRTQVAELTIRRADPLAEHLTVKQVAAEYAVSEKWVYEHKGLLGAKYVGEQGSGRRPRLRFERERLEDALLVAKLARTQDGPRRRRRERRPPDLTKTAAGNPLLF